MESEGKKFEVLDSRWGARRSREAGTEIRYPLSFSVKCVSCNNIWTARKTGEGHFRDQLTGKIGVTCPHCGANGSLDP